VRTLVLAMLLFSGCNGPEEDTFIERTAALIDEAGGTLVSDDGALEVTVPPGALEETVLLTISPGEDPGDVHDLFLGPLYEIGPSGTQFDVPVTLAFHYDPEDLGDYAPEEVRAAVWAEPGWEALHHPLVASETGVITGDTYHFSVFGLAPNNCSLMVACDPGGGLPVFPEPPAFEPDPVLSGEIGFLSYTSTAAEPDGQMYFVVRRRVGSKGEASVWFQTLDGKAEAGRDYTATNTQITFADGDTADKTVAVPVHDDTSILPKDLYVILSNPTGAVLGIPAIAKGTILNDDPYGIVEFESAEYAAAEDDGTVEIALRRWGRADSPVAVTVSGGDRRLSGTVAHVFWGANDTTTRNATFTVNDDSRVTEDSDIELRLSRYSTSGVYEVPEMGPRTTARLRISEDDAPHGMLRAPAYPVVQENVGTFELEVARIGGASGRISASYTTEFVSGGATTADVTPTTGSLVWESGDSSPKRVSVPILDDSIQEPDESFRIRLYSLTGGATVEGRGEIYAVIRDDELPSGLVDFTVPEMRVADNAGHVSLTVRRTGSAQGAIRAPYEIFQVAGSTSETIGAGRLPATIAFADGDRADKTLSIPLFDTISPKGSRSFEVRIRRTDLANPYGGVGENSSVLVWVDDPEDALTFAGPTGTATEGATTTVVVTRPAPGKGRSYSDIQHRHSMQWPPIQVVGDAEFADTVTRLELPATAMDDSSFSYPQPTWLELDPPQANFSGQWWATRIDVIDDDGFLGPSFGGVVVLDTDFDGWPDRHETALQGARVIVKRDSTGDGQYDTTQSTFTVSDATSPGDWVVRNDPFNPWMLPAGDYQISLDLPIPTGKLRLVAPETPYILSATTDTLRHDLHFVVEAAGVVYGAVFEDLDADGVKDPGEAGIGGIGVRLMHDPSGTGTYTEYTRELTDPAGNWFIPHVEYGAYRVQLDASTIAPTQVSTGSTLPYAVILEAIMTEARVPDIGLSHTLEIEGGTWTDTNGNGTHDGEPGLVAYLDLSKDTTGDGTPDTVVASTTSDASGRFSFGGLPPGTYSVAVDTGRTFASPAVQSASWASQPVALALANSPIDLGWQGYYPAPSVAGLVYGDTDGDGTLDTGETGASGVTVTLHRDSDNDGAYETHEGDVTTPADGSFLFSNLRHGSFQLSITPTGGLGVTTLHPFAFTLAAGEHRTDVGFGVGHTGRISGNVFEDHDGDGVFDAGEFGLASQEVALLRDDDADGVPEVTVTAIHPLNTGAYAFTGLPAGTYRVVVDDSHVQSGEWVLTTAAGLYDRVLAAHASIVLPDFGYAKLASVQGTVFWDDDADGARDAGESGISGATVQLRRDDDGNGSYEVLADSETVGGDGAYQFTAVPGAHYQLDVDPATVPTDALSTTQNHPHAFVPTSNDLLTTDFGFGHTGQIAGVVFDDRDGDGTRDAGEPGFPAPVEVYFDEDGNGTPEKLVMSAVPPTGGAWSKGSLPPGNYRVLVDETASGMLGAVRTTGTNPWDTTLSAGGTTTAPTLGYALTGSIAGTAFADADGDGVQDGGETGQTGAKVLLRRDADGNGSYETDTADHVVDSTGAFSFADLLPGAYELSIDPATLPGGVSVTTSNLPFVQALTPGQAVSGLKFGFGNPASLEVHVFGDLDYDGHVDQGEPGLPVPVTLYGDQDADGVAETIVNAGLADASGHIRFGSLTEGLYAVTVSMGDPSLVRTTPEDDPWEMFLTAFQQEGVQFGWVAGASITGGVYWDLDGDGAWDTVETGLADVHVELRHDRDGDGNPERFAGEAVTDASGAFAADGLVPGTYHLTTVLTTLPDVTWENTDGNEGQAVVLTPGGAGAAADMGWSPREICDNGIDDNYDFLADCADPTCADDPACTPGACADLDLGSAVGSDVETGVTTGQGDDYTPTCTSAGSPDVTLAWSPPADGVYRIDLHNSSYDTVLAVLDGLCDVELRCNDDAGTTTSEVEGTFYVGQTVVIVVDGYAGAAGDFSVSITDVTSEVGLSYTLLDLGVVGGTESFASDLNASGAVVGHADDAGGALRAILWTPTGLDLGDLGGGEAVANGIDDLGNVVGRSLDTTATWTAFYWDTSTMTEQTMGDEVESELFRIAGGTAVGRHGDGYGNWLAMTNNGQAWYFLTTGGAAGTGYDINTSGVAVGEMDYSGNLHATRWPTLSYQDLGTFGGPESVAHGVSESGYIAGAAQRADGSWHAFQYYPGGIFLDLGTLGGVESVGYDVDSTGKVVGEAQTPFGPHAFLWTGSAMYDLNLFVADLQGLELTDARAMNASGQIAGNAIGPGGARAVLLTPE